MNYNGPRINLNDEAEVHGECDTCPAIVHEDDLIVNEAGQFCEDCDKAARDEWAAYFGIKPGQKPPLALRGAAGDYDHVSRSELIRRGDAA